MTPKKNVPALRFKAFHDEWRPISLGSISELTSGFPFQSEFFTKGGDGHRVITPKNFTKTGYASFTNENTKATTETIDEKWLCKPGDLLILLTDLTPSCELLGKPLLLRAADDVVYLNQRIVKVTITNNGFSKEFICQSLLTDNYHKRIKETATGSTVRHSSNKIILTTQLSFPSLPEQQKIAAFLTAVDDKLQQLTRKKALLDQYKKGVMQQIFSREIRFQDDNGNEFPEWEEKTLGEIVDMRAGKFISASNISEVQHKNNFPCYGGNGLRGYTTSYSHEGVYSLIGRQGALCGNITLAQGKFYATEHAVVVTPKESVDSIWLYYALILLNLNKYATGQAQPGLSVDNLLKVQLEIPMNKPEQQKIASFLSAIDDKINQVTTQLQQAQQFKKGLLQGMFV